MLISDANSTIKELSRLLLELRQVAPDAAADRELGRWYVNIQAEMNRNSAMLNKAVSAARQLIARQLAARVVRTEDGIRLSWDAALFKEDAEVTET